MDEQPGSDEGNGGGGGPPRRRAVEIPLDLDILCPALQLAILAIRELPEQAKKELSTQYGHEFSANELALVQIKAMEILTYIAIAREEETANRTLQERKPNETSH